VDLVDGVLEQLPRVVGVMRVHLHRPVRLDGDLRLLVGGAHGGGRRGRQAQRRRRRAGLGMGMRGDSTQ